MTRTLLRFSSDPRSLRHAIDRLLEEGASDLQGCIPEAAIKLAVDLWESEDQLWLKATVPGLRAEDLTIEAIDNQLTLSGAFDGETAHEGRKWHLRERQSVQFRRHLTLPFAVNANGVAATIENGILTLVLPKAESAKALRIPVKPAATTE